MLYVAFGVGMSMLMAHMGYKGRESVVGIDLGTTFSVVAIRRNDGEVEVISNKHGKLTTPSVVSYQRNGRTLVGADAVAVQEKHFRTTIYNAKRFIGKRFSDEGVEQDIADHPFRIVSGPPLGKEGTGNIYFDVKNNPVSPKLVSPEAVGREIITSLMADVKRHLGHTQVGWFVDSLLLRIAVNAIAYERADGRVGRWLMRACSFSIILFDCLAAPHVSNDHLQHLVARFLG